MSEQGTERRFPPHRWCYKHKNGSWYDDTDPGPDSVEMISKAEADALIQEARARALEEALLNFRDDNLGLYSYEVWLKDELKAATPESPRAGVSAARGEDNGN